MFFSSSTDSIVCCALVVLFFFDLRAVDVAQIALGICIVMIDRVERFLRGEMASKFHSRSLISIGRPNGKQLRMSVTHEIDRSTLVECDFGARFARSRRTAGNTTSWKCLFDDDSVALFCLATSVMREPVRQSRNCWTVIADKR